MSFDGLIYLPVSPIFILNFKDYFQARTWRLSFFSFPELWFSQLEFNSRKICQHLTNWKRYQHKVWSSANSLLKWCFCSQSPSLLLTLQNDIVSIGKVVQHATPVSGPSICYPRQRKAIRGNLPSGKVLRLLLVSDLRSVYHH